MYYIGWDGKAFKRNGKREAFEVMNDSATVLSELGLDILITKGLERRNIV